MIDKTRRRARTVSWLERNACVKARSSFRSPCSELSDKTGFSIAAATSSQPAVVHLVGCSWSTLSQSPPPLPDELPVAGSCACSSAMALGHASRNSPYHGKINIRVRFCSTRTEQGGAFLSPGARSTVSVLSRPHQGRQHLVQVRACLVPAWALMAPQIPCPPQRLAQSPNYHLGTTRVRPHQRR